MQYQLLTSILALSAPLTALAAPTAASAKPTTSAAAPAATSSAVTPTINHAWEIVSSLSGTLNWHQASINFTVAFFPENPSDAQKVSFNSSVSVNIDAMSKAIETATTDIKAIARIAGKASEDEAKEVEKVTNELSALVYGSTGTVKQVAKVYRDSDIVIIGGGVFGPFVDLFESFVIGVEDVFLGFVPGVEVLANSLVDVLDTVIAIL